MAKRKATDNDTTENLPRRSTRHRAVKAEETDEARIEQPEKTTKKASKETTPKPVSKTATTAKAETPKPVSKPVAKSSSELTEATSTTASLDDASPRQYWLLKAEPETRLENGVDVSFSIDDLAACTEPEPWDGIRNYAARNNLRAMKKGDLAFFYQSNCKTPGIVGIMEIVREHSPDESAHNPKAPYYDASSKPSDPKWSVVHVEFRRKLAAPVTLHELRAHGVTGQPLASMQLIKQSRLSVSKVTPLEWEYILSLALEKEADADKAQRSENMVLEL